jgi:amidase
LTRLSIDARKRLLIESPLNNSEGLKEQACRIVTGHVGPVELLEETFARIEAIEPTLNAFRVLRPEEALAEARSAERKAAAGERLPLLGVPVAIKDDVDIAGLPTAFGCVGDFPVKAADGWIAERLKAAGAIIVGKTNTPEIGLWPFTEGRAFGVTRNPWSLGHTPGGSSGGAAAAVAAGMVGGAVGSDGAGSIRIPAAWTNLVGIKPQRGRVSTWPDPDAFHGLTVNGPLARTVSDAALLLDVLCGNRDGDRHRPAPPSESFHSSARQKPRLLRIGLALNVPFSGAPAQLDPEVRAAVEDTASLLEGLGHSIEPTELPYGFLIGGSIMPRSMAGIGDWVDRVPDRNLLDARVRAAAKKGAGLRSLLPGARLLEETARRRVGRAFRKFDVLLTPTTAQPPLPIGSCDGLSEWETDKRVVAACPYAWPWNVLGWPGVNIPAGFTAEGLPLGAQLLGPGESEPLLVSLAAQAEEVAEWHLAEPPIEQRALAVR